MHNNQLDPKPQFLKVLSNFHGEGVLNSNERESLGPAKGEGCIYVIVTSHINKHR